MDLTNEFVVPLDPSETWKVLLDIRRIIPCVPGAELLDVMDDQTYKGKVSVKLGPVALAFVGTAKFEELDEAAKRAKVLAKGTDAKGRGGANSVVQFRLEPVEDGTKVIVETNVNLSGSVAQYGRGTGVIQGVASQLTAQFAQNLKAMLAHGDDEVEPPTPVTPAPDIIAPVLGAPQAAQAVPDMAVKPAPVPAAQATSQAQPTGDGAPVADAAAIAAVVRTEAAAARAEAAAARVEAAVARVEAAAARVETSAAALKSAARPTTPLPQAKPISGFSLMFTVLWGMITGLFSSKKNG